MKFELEQFNRDVPDDLLLGDLSVVAAKLTEQGLLMTYRAYDKAGKYASSTIAARFGTWNRALQMAGISSVQEKNVPIEDLFDNLKVVWIAKGAQPVFRDMSSPNSRYGASVYSGRFGSWRKALEAFVGSVTEEENEIHAYEMEVKMAPGLKRTKRDPSLALRFLILKRDNFACVSCGRSPASFPGLVLEIDHHIPWSSGGETIEGNLKTLCFDCNRGKGAR